MLHKTKLKNKLKSRPRLHAVNPVTVLLVKKILTGLLVFVVIALIIVGIWYGSRIQKLTISEITVTEGDTIDAEEIKRLVTEQLAGTYFGIIPKRFILLYPHDQILLVVNKVERIKDVKVARLDSKTISISYSEYVPDALWCQDKDVDDCLFLDENGYAFGKAPELTGGSFLRYYTLQDSPASGKNIITKADYLATRDFATKLAESGWFVRLVEVDSVRDVFYTLEEGGELKATLKETTEKTLGYLNTIRQSKEFKHLAPGNFQYIDLRFGTKIFVNEKIEQETNDGTNSTTTEIISERTPKTEEISE